MTIMTLWYTLLWAAMMVIGGACYEQRFITKKRGSKFKTLELAGWCIIIMAMLGMVHGVLYLFNLIAW